LIRSLKLVGTVALAKPDRMLVGKAARDSSALLLVWTSESHLRRNEDKHEAAQQPESATYLSESTMTNPAAQLSQGRADTDRAFSANGFGSPQMIVSMSGGSKRGGPVDRGTFPPCLFTAAGREAYDSSGLSALNPTNLLLTLHWNHNKSSLCRNDRHYSSS